MKNVFLTMAMTMGMSLLCQAYTTTSSESLHVWVDNVTLIADGTTVTHMTLYENDPTLNYSNFNMQLTIPKGVTVAKVKQGRETVDDIFYTDRGTSNHVIKCNILEDGVTLKIIGYSAGGEELFNDDENGTPLDALFTIGLIASPDTQPGVYTVAMSDVKFAYGMGDACVPMEEPIYSEMTIEDKTTGVEEIAVDNDVNYYDLYGRNVGKDCMPGIYIRNGKKIVIK